jgi:hypothetical protein
MKLKIATDFSKAPGPRYIGEGKHSGQEFREQILYPRVLAALSDKTQLTIDLDGTFGFGTSFLEEAFGGLIRDNKLGIDDILGVICFVSTEEPDLVDEIKAYMQEAASEEKRK